MKRGAGARDEERYIGLDVHKHYVTIGGMNGKQEIVLRGRDVEMGRFREWAKRNLLASDEVVLEATTNTWDIYDTVVSLVARVVVANAAEVKQIANARVKTDNQDVLRLVRLLILNMVPEVWVPPVKVRELRALISYRWRLVKMGTMIQNRLHSLLHRHNIEAPEGKIHTEENLAWWQKLMLSPLEDMRLKQELGMLEQVRANIAAVERELGRLSNREPWASQAVYLMQMPGVEVVITMTILAAIGDIRRLRTSGSWWAMPGWEQVSTIVVTSTATRASRNRGVRSCAGH